MQEMNDRSESKKNENTKKIEDAGLDKVSGGSFFKDFSDDQYNIAGVELAEAGPDCKGGFLFKGKPILREEAATIVDFYHFFGRVPDSLKEALDWERMSLFD